LNKIILTDCDGVLLDWIWSFNNWMTKHGYNMVDPNTYAIHDSYAITPLEAKRLVAMFNESIHISRLTPLRDSIKYIRMLHEQHGVVLHVVTSVSADPLVAEARKQNLVDVFGKSVFYRIDCLDPAISKEVVLQEYADSGLLWLEDHVANYRLGERLGLDCRLMHNPWNANESNVNRIFNWKNVYEGV
jgi:hypothetical protein